MPSRDEWIAMIGQVLRGGGAKEADDLVELSEAEMRARRIDYGEDQAAEMARKESEPTERRQEREITRDDKKRRPY